jgi:hypothetical protein
MSAIAADQYQEATTGAEDGEEDIENDTTVTVPPQ